MKLVSRKIMVGVFGLGQENQLDELFVGSLNEFSDWEKYVGEQRDVLIRIRRPGLFPMEFVGILRDGEIEIKSTRIVDFLYTSDTSERESSHPLLSGFWLNEEGG